MKSNNENTNPHKMARELNASYLEPFVVHVTESYSRNVVVYAENPDMAKVLADELCEEGLLLLDFDNFADRNIETLRKAKDTDFMIYQAFGPDNLPELSNNSLKDKIQSAKEHAASKPEKDMADNEPAL